MPARSTKLRLLIRLMGPHKWILAGLIVLTVVLSVLAMLPPLVVRGIVDRVIVQGQTSLLFFLGMCMLSIPVLAAVCRYIQMFALSFIAQRFVFDIRVGLYEHLLGLSLRFFGKHSVGKLVNRIMGDSGVVQRVLTTQTIKILSDMVCATFAIVATFLISWRLALLLLLIVGIFVANYKLSIQRIRKATRGYTGAMDRLSGGVQNRLVGSLTVKTFGMEEREQHAFQGNLWESMDLSEHALLASNTFSMNTQFIQSMGWAILYFSGCARVLEGTLSYGDVIAFTTLSMQLLVPAVHFSELARQLQDVDIALDRLTELFDEEVEVRDRPKAAPIERLSGRVDFDHVDFHYEEGTPILTDFDLHVQAGQCIALIGPTGCGKSTVLSLLTRFFDVCGGRILLDGRDIRDIALHSLRAQFGMVLQDPLLFAGSIADNIRYARPGASMAQIEEAARTAEIHDFITTLPDGYNSELGSEGTELSLGQKQRITIARAVVSDPAILIMDEATSALDSDSEQAIQTAMGRVLSNRTSFIVAHRLSTIRHADQIVVLHDGHIAERGTHEELMQIDGGRYHKLYLAHIGSGVIDEDTSA